MKINAVVQDTGEVVGIGESGINLPGRVMKTGLELPDSLSYEEWQGIGESLQGVERSLMWWIGDWLRYGDRRYGETYAKAIDNTGKHYDTLAKAKQVAERFEFGRRRPNLSFTHHREVAFLAPDIADQMLDAAEREGWSQKEIRRRVAQRKTSDRLTCATPDDDTCGVVDLFKLAERGVKFGTIYADPPWRYDNQGTRAATGNHYGGLTVDELCALPIRELAADDAHLHLWTTNAFLFDCAKIFDAWGFEFRSSFVWVKPQMGIGNYWRNSHEILLTAIRGDAKRFNDHGIMSWLECDRSRHSEKPFVVRDFIRRASPGPYLEMFTRTPADGWTSWGNEIERGLLFPHAEEVE